MNTERQDGAFPDHSNRLPVQVHDLIARMHWQNARTAEHVAPHEYNVCGWDRDDVRADEFWRLVEVVRALGRLEEWTPPAGFYTSGNRRPMLNTYLYVGEYAYWFTQPRGRPPMLNREHVSVQQRCPTRRLPGTEPAPTIDTRADEQLKLF